MTEDMNKIKSDCENLSPHVASEEVTEALGHMGEAAEFWQRFGAGIVTVEIRVGTALIYSRNYLPTSLARPMTRPSEAEVGLRALLREAAAAVQIPPAFDSERRDLVARLNRAALSTPPLPSAEPVAWDYELATTQHMSGEYGGWQKRVTRHKPSVPDGAVRNLRPLYTTPPAAAQDTARLDWLEAQTRHVDGVDVNHDGELDSPGVGWKPEGYSVTRTSYSREGPDTAWLAYRLPTLRAAIDNAMQSARAAGGE